MDPKEIVQTLLDAVQGGDYETAKSLLADDFQFSGPVPEPIGGKEWLGMSANLKAAFPDLDYHFKIEGVEGEVVKTSNQLSGTHNGEFDLTAMGMGLIPASGKSFSMASENAQATVSGSKVVSFQVQPTEGGGVMGILKQLGVSTPPQ